MTTTARTFLLIIGLMLGAMQVAVGAVPQTLSYQATLTDGVGQPVSGARDITFSLYTVPTGGTAFWTETQALTLVDGRLSVVLGAAPANPLDTSQFNGETYIGIKVGSDTEMPRQKFSSVAYAFLSGDGGVPKGGIIMWSGSVAAIPAGWALCDGANGTPNLLDKFILGAGGSLPATGGATSHSHTLANHVHPIAAESPGTSAVQGEINTVDDKDDSNKRSVGGDGHFHTVNSHSHGGQTGSAGGGNSSDAHNIPPYYALAFIMKL